MSERVLLIDDDPNLLSALQRHLRKKFDIVTAENGPDALKLVQDAQNAGDCFAVALSDMRMPGMDGIETLKRVRDISPNTVRLMLTGNADQQTAIDAINHGNIFRFYTKPCPPEDLSSGIDAAMAQYRLIVAERELLEKTLAGSIKILVDVVSMNDPIAYATASRLREWVRQITTDLELPQRWQLDVAAMLVPIGQVAVPPELIAKKRDGAKLSDAEQSLFERAPEAARNLITNIPRLSGVAEIVYLQDRGYDGSGFPADGPKGNDIPFDARLLKILKDLAEITQGGPPVPNAFEMMAKKHWLYDPHLFKKIRTSLEETGSKTQATIVEVPLAALRAGHTIVSDLKLSNGHLILAANTRLSEAQVERLRALRRLFQFVEPVKVRV